MKLTITLSGEIITAALSSIVWEYAFKSINRVATVEEAPEFTKADEKRWRDLRDTLQSVGMVELPGVDHPEWPVRYSYSDDIVTKSKITEIAGIQMRHILETKKKKGAKPRPLYSKDTASKAARAYRVKFFEALGVKWEER